MHAKALKAYHLRCCNSTAQLLQNPHNLNPYTIPFCLIIRYHQNLTKIQLRKTNKQGRKPNISFKSTKLSKKKFKPQFKQHAVYASRRETTPGFKDININYNSKIHLHKHAQTHLKTVINEGILSCLKKN